MIVHTVSYFVVGFLALTLFDYGAEFAEEGRRGFMRQTDDPLVRAGVLFQPIRGLLFGWVFFLLRDVLFRPRRGWLVGWTLLVIVGIVSTFGPAPGSIEGLVFTTFPMTGLWGGLLEVLTQSLLLSVVTWYWVLHPEKRWLGWALGIAFFVAIALTLLGLLVMVLGLPTATHAGPPAP